MKIRLQITSVESIQNVTSQAGNAWRKRNVVGNTVGSYPKMVCVEVWNDRCDNQFLVAGNTLDISFDLESRLFNGRYYTTVKAYDFAIAQDVPAAQPMPKQDAVQAVQMPQVKNCDNDTECKKSEPVKAGGVIYQKNEADTDIPNYQDTTELPF